MSNWKLLFLCQIYVLLRKCTQMKIKLFDFLLEDDLLYFRIIK